MLFFFDLKLALLELLLDPFVLPVAVSAFSVFIVLRLLRLLMLFVSPGEFGFCGEGEGDGVMSTAEYDGRIGRTSATILVLKNERQNLMVGFINDLCQTNVQRFSIFKNVEGF